MTDTRYVIASIPKAGTYLAAAILKHMGVKELGIHLVANRRHMNYGAAPSLEEARMNRHAYWRDETTRQVLKTMPPHSFLLTHIGPILRQGFIHPTKVLFMQRNLRDCLVSYCRWESRLKKWQVPKGLTQPEMLRAWWFARGRKTGPIWSSTGWLPSKPDLVTHFSALTGKLGIAAQALAFGEIARLVGWKGDIAAAIVATIDVDTITWSGRLSRWEEWWSPAMEDQFANAGLKLINDYMGYEHAQGT